MDLGSGYGCLTKTAIMQWIPGSVSLRKGKNELTQFLGNFRFPGHAQKYQSVITFPCANQAYDVLDGNKVNTR